MDAVTEKPGSRNLLDHFSTMTDPRHPWRVEVLLLVVCATIASYGDYDDMVDWGETHLSFLRRFSEFYFGIPCADWLRTLMNRIDPDLFSACFMAWVRDWWPETPDLIERPCPAASWRWWARNEGLWAKNTENAAKPRSAMA